MIGGFFGEVWDESVSCDAMCDNCKRKRDGQYAVAEVDLREDALALCEILKKAQSAETRLTPLKLVDEWLRQNRQQKRKNPPSREQCERSLVRLITQSVLREDFHFTAYSTICYLLPGTRASGSPLVRMYRVVTVTLQVPLPRYTCIG